MLNKCDIISEMDIKKLREALKVSYEQMAVKLGVSAMTVRRWEAGNNKPSRLAMRQLSRLEKRIGR